MIPLIFWTYEYICHASNGEQFSEPISPTKYKSLCDGEFRFMNGGMWKVDKMPESWHKLIKICQKCKEITDCANT